MNKVSVIVPIYNAGNKLHKCIKSILKQTFMEFELILVNDGSTDNSLSICKKYERKDKRIVVINKNNQGSIIARNTGLNHASANYLMFVDADDWIDKTTIQKLYNSSIENEADISICNMYKTMGSGKLIRKEFNNSYFNKSKLYNEEEIKKQLVTAYFHGHPFPSSLCAKLYKKELFINSGKYIDRIKFLGDDLFYNLEILMRAKKVKMVNSPLYFYRAGGFTSKYMPYLFDDMVNGYLIQKEIICENYQSSKEKEMNGASIMLLNTLKTCLYNLFNSSLNHFEIKKKIIEYTSNPHILECTKNNACKRYFDASFLEAIVNKDSHYLYNLGEKLYKKSKTRRTALNILSKIC